ncbi:MAG: GAF domain-containing protein, partial [Anaerolineae bacterium]|nr:GAF domain-containing protein [Anaerolineae bacterium]
AEHDPLRALGQESHDDAKDARSGVVTVSLALQGEPIGTVGIDGDPQSPLSPEQRELVDAILEQAAQALEGARLSEMTQQALLESEEQAQRLSALNQMSALLSEATSREAIFEVLASRAGQIIESDRITITLLNEEQDRFEVLVLEGGAGAVPVGAQLPVQGTLLGRVVRENRVLVHPVLPDSEYLDLRALSEQGLSWVMSAPLVVGGQPIGTLNVAHSSEETYSERDESLMQQVASLLGTNLERNQLLVQTRAALDDAEATHRRYLRETWEAFLAERGAELEGYLAGPDGLAPVGDFWTTEMEQAVAQQTAVTALTGQDEQATKLLALPIQHRGQTIGVIDIAREGTRWTEDEISLIQSLVEGVGDMIESERLFETSESTRAQTELLYQASQQISAADSAERVYPIVLNVVASTPIDQAAVFIFETPARDRASGEQMLAAFWDRSGAASPVPPGTVRPVDQDPFLSVLTRDEAFVVSDVQTDERIQGSLLTAVTNMGVRALALVPFTVGEEWQGYISITAGTPHGFTPDELRVYRSIADQAAIVLRSLRLYQDAERRARREQLIREITSKMRAHADMDSILSTAVRELGQALGVSRAFIRLSSQAGAEEEPATSS